MTNDTLHTRVVCVEALPWWQRLMRPARAVVYEAGAADVAEAAGLVRPLVTITSAAPMRVRFSDVEPWDQPKG